MGSASAVSGRGREWLARRFAIDVRALAAFRILLGAILLSDLALRARNLRWFYTDAGVLPRSVLRATFPGYQYVSVHALSGAFWVQVLLFLLAGVAALALLAGFQTRIATVISLLFLLSLQARNPLVLNAGDVLLRRLLFWSVFLPLGAEWSLDRSQTASRERVVSVASAALLLQVVTLYAVNAALKLRASPWRDGTAVRYAFSLEQFLVLFGDVLADFPVVLMAATWGWLALLACSVLLVALTGRSRAAFVGLFVAAHLGMLLTLKLGLFPVICLAALLPFLPTAIWDAVERRAPALSMDRLRRRETTPLERRLPDALPSLGRQLGMGIVAVLLAGMLAFNAVSVAHVDAAGVDASTIAEHQHWSMFAPSPPKTDGWFVVPGTLTNGSRVDVLTQSPVRWAKPPDVSRRYPTARWRKYLARVESGEANRRAFARSLCRRWQRQHARPLDAVSVYYVAQPTRLTGPEPTRTRRLLTYECENETAATSGGATEF
ncbi:HTTM domain-containing protein [Halorientalis brevis]|uniref:HTTM domain-containing protein n=1 Tax=Halorientalis brevis TaxID=1126241 RepID=A0ABD6CF86_9EURY|nr:HTTM domain-containing protein [Halorientalis brevis]